MDEKKAEITLITLTEKRQPGRSTRNILAITIGVVSVVLVAVAIVLTVVLVRQDDNDEPSVDESEQPVEFPISILSFQSYGVVNNSLRLSVTYRAPTQHTVMWQIQHKPPYNDEIQKAGTLRNLENDANTFNNEVTIQDVNEYINIRLSIISTSGFVETSYNGSAFMCEGFLDSPAIFKGEIVDRNDKIAAPMDINANMEVNLTLKIDPEVLRIVNESSSGLTAWSRVPGLYYWIEAVNTSADPPHYYAIYNLTGQDVKKSNDNLFSVTIIVPTKFVQYGCVLSVSILDSFPSSYILGIRHGVSIKILSPINEDVVSEGVLAVIPCPKKLYIYAKRATLTCLAMGNPHPKVTWYKRGNGQEYISLEAAQEQLINDEYRRKVGYTVETNVLENQGKYQCRAENGLATSETSTEVIFGKFPVINVTQTGVIENTTIRTTIQCQASGIPRPAIQLRLVDDYGPDLIKTGLYQVTNTSQGNDTTKVTLTISPPDYRIHTVYCVALGTKFIEADPVKIEIYPCGGCYRGLDWNLSQSMWDLIDSHSTNT